MRIFLILSFNPRGMCDPRSDAPLFSINRCRTVGPHQSPITFKALELSLPVSDLPPLAIFIAPENYRYHAASKVIGSQIHWLSPFGGPTLLWLTAWAYHRITAPPSCRYIKGRDSG